MSASHLSRLASHTVDSIDLKESTLEKRNSSNQQELLRVQVVPENDSERPLSPKGHRGGSASMEELKVFLDEAHLNLKSMQPKKLRALRYGEELRDLLSRVMSELELHSDRIEANLDKPGVASCVTKLRSTVSKAQPLIKRIQSTKYLVNKTFKRDVQFLFQEINSNYTSLFMELSMSIASTTNRFGTIMASENENSSTVSKTEPSDICIRGDKFYFGHGESQNYREAFKHYQAAAQVGDHEAMVRLASLYETGTGVERDLEESREWLSTAAKLGNLQAAFKLGELQLEAGSEIHDPIQKQEKLALAMSNFKSAAERGHGQSQTKLGYFFEKGLIGCPDVDTAADWYLRAAENGDAAGQTSLGSFYFRGISIDRNYDQAVYWFRKAAIEGNAAAQNNLAMCYETGKGVSIDQDKAISLYRSAIGKGNPNAMNNLAFVLFQLSTSDRCTGNRQQMHYEALQLFIRASAAGVVEADYGLGLLLEGRSYNYIRDCSAALRHYCAAADSIPGHGKAALQAANMFYSGIGTTINLERALHYYKIAARLQVAQGHNALGLMYEEGKGCPPSLEEAFEHYGEAARLGSADGHFNRAGILIMTGTDREQLEKAADDLKSAMDQGHPSAHERLAHVNRKLREL